MESRDTRRRGVRPPAPEFPPKQKVAMGMDRGARRLFVAASRLAALAVLGWGACHAQSTEYLRLKVLVVVYANTFTDTASPAEIEHLYGEVDEGVQYFWRISQGRLHIDVDRIVIDRLLPVDQFWEMSEEHYWMTYWEIDGVHSVRNDLLELGYPKDSYDSVFVFYAWENGEGHHSQLGGGAYGVNSLLGKAAYAAVPLAWGPDSLNLYFEHELLHNIRSIIQTSGYPEFPNIHEPQQVQGVYDDNDTWYAWILRRMPDAYYTGPRTLWGTVESVDDADGDRLADRSPPGASLPLTEADLGSSTARVDTDEDGADDRQEAFRAVRRGTDPTLPDTDGDGIPDGQDPTPFDAVDTLVRYASPTVDANVEIEEYTRVGDFGSRTPGDARARLHMAWDHDYVYFAVTVIDDVLSTPWQDPRYNDAVFLRIDAAADGFFYQGEGNYLVRIAPRAGESGPTRTAELWLPDKSHDSSLLAAEELPAAYQAGPGAWQLEIAVPADPLRDLRPEFGNTIRLQVELQDYDGSREEGWDNHTAFEEFATVTFWGDDCNQNGIHDPEEPDCNQNGIPDDCDIAEGRSPDSNRNGRPDECDPTCLAGIGARPGQIELDDGQGVLAFAGTLAAGSSGGAAGLLWKGATFTDLGGGEATEKIEAATLYLDRNESGTIDEGDDSLGSASGFDGASRELRFTSIAASLPPGAPVSYILVLRKAQDSTVSPTESAAPPGIAPRLPPAVLGALLGVVALARALGRKGRRVLLASAAMLIGASLLIPGCGGSGGGSDPLPPAPSSSSRVIVRLDDLDVREAASGEPAIVRGLPLIGWPCEF